MRRLLAGLGERVAVVVNCDHFTMVPEWAGAYPPPAVQRLMQGHCARVQCYGTMDFLKSQPNNATD